MRSRQGMRIIRVCARAWDSCLRGKFNGSKEAKKEAMSGRKPFLALLGVALLLGSTGLLRAQRAPYGVEEFNAYVDTTRTQDPNQRLQAMEAFLQNYPESVLRAFVYPGLSETTYALKQYGKTMEAVDAFLGMNRDQVVSLYKQSNFDEARIESVYYREDVLYTFSFLQSFRGDAPDAEAVAAKATERARRGLEMNQRLYATVQPQPGVSVEQLKQVQAQEVTSFHTVLAFAAWRAKDYETAVREYTYLVGKTPNDARLNYQLARSYLQKRPAEYQQGFWYLARAIALNVSKSEEVRDFLTRAVAGYQQVLPACLEGQVSQLIGAASESVRPPAGWALASSEQVNALRQQMTVKRIFDDLKVGGETAHMMWLASCGTEIGLGEGSQPELAVLILEVAETTDNLVTLRVAAGQEAVDAKAANMEVKVTAPPEAASLKGGDVVRIAGKLSQYRSDPDFLLRLSDGKVNPEDIPKTR